ncbi:MAG TPA: STAS domain-containing protein [Gaiellaceae bacterium]|nr:STAS domain-containing protein [Gaiellaceae bacterium]
MDAPQIEVTVATVKAGDSAYVVTVGGELDLCSAPRLTAELEALVADAPEIVLDLGGVTFADSTAIGAILAAARRLADCGGRLSLVVPAGSTRKLIGLVGVDRMLPVYETADRALEHLVGSVVLRKLEGE